MAERIYFAANNGDLGGGEVMLLTLAEAARDLDREVSVVAPSGSKVLEAAQDSGYATVGIKCHGRRLYLRNLRAWDLAARRGLLWCNGLAPALATSGRHRRVVHVHLLPMGSRAAALQVARLGADAVVVPSEFVASRVRGARVLHNWSRQVIAGREPPGRVPATVGFIGRPSVAKGVVTLAEAVALLNRRNPDRVRLLVAGEPLFVSAKEQHQVNDALAALGAAVWRPGWLPTEEFFSRVDLAVFPSIVEETFGLVVAEAMSAGVPFVISDSGALREVAGPGHEWVAKAGDAADLAAVIDRVLNDWARSSLECAYERWNERFSPAAGRERLADLLHDLHA